MPSASSASPRPVPARRRRELHEGWTLTVTDGPAPFPVRDVPATVPGTFITDLVDAGLIPDPYVDRNEHELAWTGECDVAYRTSFEHEGVPAGERIELVASSLDTVARILLNGQEVAHTANQHRSWRIDVTGALRPGANELEIHFTAPLRAARETQRTLGALPNSGNDLPFNMIRKMACNFGWDWGPVLVTSGIAGPIALESIKAAHLEELRPRVEVDGSSGTVQVRAAVLRAGAAQAPLEARLVVESPEGEEVAAVTAPVEDDVAQLRAEVPEVRRWWPRGYGQQPLYGVRVELRAGGELLDARERRVGFRTAGIREEADEIGTSFTVVVNDSPVLAKGANWIPADCFPTRVSEEDLRHRIADATEAGMNMLRIWGGGLYESDALYDLADEAGLLVWQDFTLACAAYPEVEPLLSEIEAEARENIVRLAWHPSLIHWNGGNENVEGYWTWGWREQLAEGVRWGDHYYSHLFPALLAELDPTRSYTPSSPYSRPLPADPKNPDHGTIHDWRVWNSLDYTHYRDLVPRFSAEFGFQGPANRATLERAITERPLEADSPAMLSHQKASEGQRKLRMGYRPHLPEPQSWEDFHATTQLTQARALICGIGHYRSHWPTCGGTIVWQLNDCWPVTSWAAVDGDGRRKLLWHALRAMHAPVLVTVQPRGEGLIISIGNDTDEPIDAPLRITRRTYGGAVLAEWSGRAAAAARANGEVAVPDELATPEDATGELLVAQLGVDGGAGRGLHWFAEDKDSALEPGALVASAARDGEDVVVTLRATGAVRDACLFADAVTPEAVADRQLVSLLAGEEAVIRVRGAGAAHPEAFLREDVLISANHLVARGGEAPEESAVDAPYGGPGAYAGPTG